MSGVGGSQGSCGVIPGKKGTCIQGEVTIADKLPPALAVEVTAIFLVADIEELAGELIDYGADRYSWPMIRNSRTIQNVSYEEVGYVED